MTIEIVDPKLSRDAALALANAKGLTPKERRAIADAVFKAKSYDKLPDAVSEFIQNNLTL